MASGTGPQYMYRSLYRPNQGLFCQLQRDLKLGTFVEVGLTGMLPHQFVV